MSSPCEALLSTLPDVDGGDVVIEWDEETGNVRVLDWSDSKCNTRARAKPRQDQYTASLQEKNLLLVASLLAHTAFLHN